MGLPLTLTELGQVQACLVEQGITDQDTLDKISLCLGAPAPEPPEPPEPPLIVGCGSGFSKGTDWWLGFCVDEPNKFTTPAPGVGSMGKNADARKRFADDDRWPAGKVKFDLRFMTAQLPTGGGKHLWNITSHAVHLGDASPYIDWLRFDVGLAAPNYLLGIYMSDHSGSTQGHILQPWKPAAPLPAPGTWGTFEFEWNRIASDEVRVTMEGFTKHFDILPNCRNPRCFGPGNMDDLHLFGGSPRIEFRNLVLTRLA